jgi:hypothetical protein
MEAVNDVEAEEQRDLQSRVLDRDSLKPIDDRGISDEQQGADRPCAYVGLNLFRLHELLDVEELIELAHLLLDRHLR